MNFSFLAVIFLIAGLFFIRINIFLSAIFFAVGIIIPDEPEKQGGEK